VLGALQGWALREEAALAVLAAVGAVVYGSCIAALFGPQWLGMFRRRTRP
jgi:hypothetical protein